MKPLDDTTPEEANEHRLVGLLRGAYGKTVEIGDEQRDEGVARVRERLQARSSLAEEMGKDQDGVAAWEAEEIPDRRGKSERTAGHRKRSRVGRFVSMLAAVL